MICAVLYFIYIFHATEAIPQAITQPARIDCGCLYLCAPIEHGALPLTIGLLNPIYCDIPGH